MGSAETQGSKAKPTKLGQSRRVTRVRDEETQRVSSSFVSKSRPGGFLHSPSCWLASSYLCFLLGLPRKTCETTWLRFDQGGISPCLILWRGICHDWLSPPNNDPGSTQIPTQHCGAQSHTVSQLASSGTTLTSKSMQFSPSRFTKHLNSTPHSDNQDKTMGLC
jgi:hypothetical protein